MATSSQPIVLLLVCSMALSFTSGCNSYLPASQMIGATPYMLQKMMECKGHKVYDIENVQDIHSCQEACRQFNCAAVNLFQLGEFQFKCEILDTIDIMVPAQGAACYYTPGAYPGAGLGWGRRK